MCSSRSANLLTNYNFTGQRRRKIFEARMQRGRRTYGQGVCPPDTEKNFKIEHVRSLEILLL